MINKFLLSASRIAKIISFSIDFYKISKFREIFSLSLSNFVKKFSFNLQKSTEIKQNFKYKNSLILIFFFSYYFFKIIIIFKIKIILFLQAKIHFEQS